MEEPVSCSVVCVLRTPGEYLPQHVKWLYQGVQRWWPADLPLRFVALTDTPILWPGIEERPLYYKWQGWWAKMELFDGAMDDLGDILFFDLDTMIVGPLGQVAKARPLTFLQDFYKPQRLQSGMMYLPLERRPEVSAAFLGDPKAAMALCRGDGEFLDYLFRNKAATWQGTLAKDHIVSYKLCILPRVGRTIPPETRIVCFHGKPRPWNSPLWEHGG